MRLLSSSLFVLLSACADFPALDGTISPADRAAPFPDLVPLAPLLAQAQTRQSRLGPAAIATADSRIAALRARAAGLRGPVVDAATRARMRRGVNTTALR